MNLHTTLTSTERMAAAVLAEDWATARQLGFGHEERPYYDTEEWTSAADYALESGDYSEFEYMLEMQADYDRFLRWQRRDEHREFEDFGNWRDAELRKREAA